MFVRYSNSSSNLCLFQKAFSSISKSYSHQNLNRHTNAKTESQKKHNRKSTPHKSRLSEKCMIFFLQNKCLHDNEYRKLKALFSIIFVKRISRFKCFIKTFSKFGKKRDRQIHQKIELLHALVYSFPSVFLVK